jgi:hypothetical protein
MSLGATDDALAYGARIRDLILHHSGGWADAHALEKFRLLAGAAARAIDDAACTELMRTAEQYAADLFSVSAHHKWARSRTSGADVLRLCILAKLDAFRERLKRLQQEGLALRRISPVDRNGSAGDEV